MSCLIVSSFLVFSLNWDSLKMFVNPQMLLTCDLQKGHRRHRELGVGRRASRRALERAQRHFRDVLEAVKVQAGAASAACSSSSAQGACSATLTTGWWWIF